MAAYAFMLPILPGQEETDRRLFAEMQGPRRAEYGKCLASAGREDGAGLASADAGRDVRRRVPGGR